MTQTFRESHKPVILAVLALSLAGCGGSGSDGAGSGGKGGGSASASAGSGSGGAASASSTLASGGASGGASRSGGQTLTGGSSSPGGSRATSGSTSTTGGGGRSAQGGAAGSGDLGGTGGGAGGKATGGSGIGGGAGSLSTATGGTGTTGGQGGSAGGSGAGGTTGSGGSTAVSCPSTPLAAGDSTHTIKSGGRDRTYILHIPSGYTGSKAVPLLVDFHPHGSTGPDWRKNSPYPKLTDADGVVSAYPSAIGDWDVGPCCADGVDDVGFAKDMVKEIKGLACIDPKRVYAAGFSMGGGMTNYVACHAADVFAAFGPAAFDVLKEIVADCKPGRPITVASFRGTADPSVPYAGGLSTYVTPINFLGAVATMKKWAEWDGCTGSAADLGNGCQGYAASQCQGEEVILCTKQGGSHEAADANLIWPVLKRHSMP